MSGSLAGRGMALRPGAARWIGALVLAAGLAAPALGGIDKSFDWPTEKRKLTIKVKMGDTKLGGTKLSDVIQMAVDQLNLDKDATMWEWVIDNTAASPDICITTGTPPKGKTNGGAETTGFDNKDKDNKLKGPLTITFDPENAKRKAGTNDWGTADKADGTKTMDPISVAMHELLHSARSDHMPNKDGATGGVGDYFNPIRPGEKHEARRLSAEDKANLKMASTMMAKKDAKKNDAAVNNTLSVGDASVVITRGAVLGQGDLVLEHLTPLTAPDPESLDGGRIFWGAQLFLNDPGSFENGFGNGLLNFSLSYPQYSYLDSLRGDITDLSSLRPYAWSPDLLAWVPIPTSGVLQPGDPSGMMPADSFLFNVPSSFLANFYDFSNGTLMVGVGGTIPTPGALGVLGMAGMLAARRRR